MGVPASLQSLLVRQSMALAGAWDARYPNDWLVWEPGAWKVPLPAAKMADTQFAVSEPVDRPVKGDCLCFELKSARSVLKLGRALENDIVINDATVSREHLVLEKKGAQWIVSGLPNTKVTLIGGAVLKTGAPVPISSGDRLTVGGVSLTYLSPAGMKARVAVEAKKLQHL